MTDGRKARALAVSLTGVLAGFASLPDAHADSKGTKIMEAVEKRQDGETQVNTLTVEFRPKRGTPRIKRFVLMRKDYGDHDKLVTFITAPAALRDSAFLVWDMVKGEDRRWLYLAALGDVRRLPPGDGRDSFFGTDFVYEDLTNRDPDKDRHQFIGEDKVSDRNCYVVESKPKDPGSVEFSKYRTWVWKMSPIVLRQDFYDSNGKVYRRATVHSVKKIQDIWTVHQAVMKNLKEGSETRMQQSDVKYNVKVDDARFSEHQLSRGAP